MELGPAQPQACWLSSLCRLSLLRIPGVQIWHLSGCLHLSDTLRTCSACHLSWHASETDSQVSLPFPAAAQPEGRQVANMGKEHRYWTLTKFLILHWARLPDKSQNVVNKSVCKLLTSTFIFKEDAHLPTPLLTLNKESWGHCFPISFSQQKVTSRHDNRCPFISN